MPPTCLFSFSIEKGPGGNQLLFTCHVSPFPLHPTNYLYWKGLKIIQYELFISESFLNGPSYNIPTRIVFTWLELLLYDATKVYVTRIFFIWILALFPLHKNVWVNCRTILRKKLRRRKSCWVRLVVLRDLKSCQDLLYLRYSRSWSCLR